MKKISTQQMCSGPLLGPIIRFTIPVMLGGILQLLFNAADLMVVGQFCGSNSVAAVGATGSLTTLLVNFFIGLSVGAGVVVAQGLGARDEKKVHQAVHTTIPLALICGAIVMVVGLIFAPHFLRWMETPPEIIDLSVLYLRIYFAGAIFMMVYNYGSSILRAAGDTQGPLLYLSIAGVLNVALNLFFVIVLKMNVAGVALATTLAQVVSCVLVVRALMKRTDACKLLWRKLGIHRRPMTQILRIGVPAGIQSSLFSISNVLIQSGINSFGAVCVAGNSAASNLEGFVYTSMNSFYQTTLTFTGQNVGAGNYKRVGKVVHTCLLLVTVAGVVLGVGMWALGEPLLSIYINDAPDAIFYGMYRLAHISVIYFVCGLMEVLVGALRGMGLSISSMVISILGVCGFRILWFLLIFPQPQFHSLRSLYISYPISWIICIVADLIIFYWVLHRQKEKYA
jgi:putative MATE family efflux protein